MKVRELIDKLSGLDPSLDVQCYSEDADRPEVFDVVEASAVAAKTWRNDNGEPLIRFENSEESRDLCILEVTRDF